jgi:hypothetical protein
MYRGIARTSSDSTIHGKHGPSHGRMLLRHCVALKQVSRELALRDSLPSPSAGSDVFLMVAHNLGEGPIQLRENTLQLARIGFRTTKIQMKASLPYREETNRGSNILQMQIHLWHPSPIQRTVVLLEQEFRQPKICSVRRVHAPGCQTSLLSSLISMNLTLSRS